MFSSFKISYHNKTYSSAHTLTPPTSKVEIKIAVKLSEFIPVCVAQTARRCMCEQKQHTVQLDEKAANLFDDARRK